MGTRAPNGLDDRIETILDEEHASTAFWGIYVEDLTTGAVLYRHNADKVMMPASNQKLFTTATALDALGSDYRYETTLFFKGDASGSVLRGDLILDGSGDPSFGSREAGTADPLREWARQLAAMGVRQIEGRIIGDDDVFDDAAYASGWDIQHIATESYAPARGGLAYRDNLIEVKIQASQTGRPPEVTMTPPGYLEIINQATTSGGRSGYPRVDRPVNAETLRLHGSVGRSYGGTLVLPVHNPTTYALHAFRHYLQEEGITVSATLHDVDDLDTKPTYEQARPLFVYASPPLGELIRVINKESDNLYAEQVFHTFGWGGTSEGGSKRVLNLLSRFGVATDGLSIRDGSGLSRKDLVTPASMGKLLVGMYEHAEKETFQASLAAGGERKTTLQHRLSGTPIRAKTGSLEYARSLSGYATTPDGHEVAFAIIANNYTAPAYRIMQVIDQIVLALTSTPVGSAGATPDTSAAESK